MEKINLIEKFNLFQETWSPKIAAELNGQYLKLVKLQGEFVWHQHAQEDELFFVVKGSLTIQFRDRNIVLNEGECLVIPAGVEHCPLATQEAWVMLLEPKSTLNTGNVQDEHTKENLEWI
jgi:mannose-6-phosphate isomerase-like protein (cupin superfamily)